MAVDLFGSSRDRLFEDDDEEQELGFGSDAAAANKEFLVYLIDASSDMLLPFEDETYAGTYFGAVMEAVEENLKQRILARDDKVGICFFNTIKKKNFQEANGVSVWAEVDDLSAELIRNFRSLRETFQKDIGSQVCKGAEGGEHPLKDGLWIVQGMLRSGTSKNVGKRVLIFTNCDDPAGDCDVRDRRDFHRTTIQRAKDILEMDIGIDLIPFNRVKENFNMKIFYTELMQLEDERAEREYITQATSKFKDLTDILKRRLYKKRVVRKMLLTVTSGVDIAIRTYAMIRPSVPSSHIFVDSRNNQPLKTDRSYICSDTGAIMYEPLKRFEEYQGKRVVFTVDEVSQIKTLTDVQLRLLGFKSLDCLQHYHNLRPPTFIYPDEEAVKGSTCAFIALYRAMLRLKKYAVAFHGTRTSSQLVALVPQEEMFDKDGNQKQTNGMNMIYLPYADDIRPAEKYHISSSPVPKASDEQVQKAAALMRRIHLKDFSVLSIPDPALQRHYATLQAVALDQDEDNLPDIKDDTLPDVDGIAKADSHAKALKDAVYGANHDEDEAEAAAAKARGSVATQKRKAAADLAVTEAQEYNWAQLADTGKLKELTAEQLKIYLRANKLPVAGKKDVLLNRILTHLGK